MPSSPSPPRAPASSSNVAPRLIRFNKPYGVLSQFTPEGRWRGLKDFIDLPGVYVAGRLDADSEGLLLLTNDGKLQARIADPRYKMEKTYWVQVEGTPDAQALAALRSGVQLSDGPTRPARARCIDTPPDSVAARPAYTRARQQAYHLAGTVHHRGSQPPGAPHDSRCRLPHPATDSLSHWPIRIGWVGTRRPPRLVNVSCFLLYIK